MTTCPECVVCEVDGQPMDPDVWAVRQRAAEESRRAVEALLAAPPRTPLAVAAAVRMTPAELGRANRRRRDDADHAAAFGHRGISLDDRRQTHGGGRRMGGKGGRR